jgi:hypothetical protein
MVRFLMKLKEKKNVSLSYMNVYVVLTVYTLQKLFGLRGIVKFLTETCESN